MFLGIFRKLSQIFSPSGTDRNYWFYVQCNFCKEILKGRVDLYNHLSIKYGEGGNKTNYFCRKLMIGSNRCYRPIEIEFTFDSNRKLIDRQINGGIFMTEGEYQAFRDRTLESE